MAERIESGATEFHWQKVEWFRHPLLVFSDYPKVERVPLEVLRSASTLETYRQHVAFGIRSGQSTLFAFESQETCTKW